MSPEFIAEAFVVYLAFIVGVYLFVRGMRP